MSVFARDLKGYLRYNSTVYEHANAVCGNSVNYHQTDLLIIKFHIVHTSIWCFNLLKDKPLQIQQLTPLIRISSSVLLCIFRTITNMSPINPATYRMWFFIYLRMLISGRQLSGSTLLAVQ